MGKANETESDFPEFLSHLEFLGYEIEAGGQDMEKGVAARHRHRADLWVCRRFMGISLTVTFGMGQNSITYLSDYLQLMNRLNKRSRVGLFYTDADDGKPNVHMYALYTARYEKRSFGVFMDIFHSDIEEMRNTSDFDFFTEDGLINVAEKQ
ncbi:MAG TPA: hypothetical protein PLR60_06365 [Syntrophorhabdaceae bacterium]|nr:hypothetical protein [Syntrophorhabdaceae bacterium]